MELRDIQMHELQMLSDFAEYCDKHELRYYLAGGTLLGAVRHQGFIPWDDDVDVIMPREDYEQFLQEVHAGQMEPYMAIDDYHEHAQARPFAKLIDPRIKVQYTLMEEAQQLWLDIFPLDGMPETDQELDALVKEQKHLEWCMWQATSSQQNISNKLKKKAKQILFSRYEKKGCLYYSKQATQLAKKYPMQASKYVGCIVGRYGKQERVEREVFETRVQMKFEGRDFYVPAGYDQYLKNLYGDYMEIPDESSRKKHIEQDQEERR